MINKKRKRNLKYLRYMRSHPDFDMWSIPAWLEEIEDEFDFRVEWIWDNGFNNPLWSR